MERLVDLPVVLLSNRGPIAVRRAQDGRRTVHRGAGGLVTALSGLAEHLPDAVWVCATATDEDSEVAREAGGAVHVATTAQPRLIAADEEAEASLLVRFVDVDPGRHADFYGVIANPLLWFLQHGLYGLAEAPDLTAREHAAYTDGYAAVNAEFADAVVAEVQSRGGHALVLVHDYHFYLVPRLVRDRCPDAVISHFVHIPWPGPDTWRVLPPPMRNAILGGLLGSDVVAFHTEGFARNFLFCAQELLGLPIDLAAMTVTVEGGRTVRARHYPISIDVAGLEQVAAGREVAQHVENFRHLLDDGRQLVLRVDRTDPSKNIVRGFRAFGRMLEQHPAMVGRVSFLAFLQPSRQDVPEYADYLGAIGAEVARVNARYSRSGHVPIELRLQEDFAMAVAAYSLFDVLVVNSIADGMNLVAKEGVVVNHRDGVLALSENTGAHEELGAFAVTLHPFDVQQQADALYQALTMDPDLRHGRQGAAAAVVRANDIGKWLSVQLADIADLISAQ